MGSKKTTTTDYTKTQTNAPPDWTAEGIKDLSGRVMSAVGQIPTEMYSGDFTAIQDKALAEEAANAYKSSGYQSGEWADFLGTLVKDYAANKTPTFGGPELPTSVAPQAPVVVAPTVAKPVIPTAADVFRPTLPTAPNVAGTALPTMGDRAATALPTMPTMPGVGGATAPIAALPGAASVALPSQPNIPDAPTLTLPQLMAMPPMERAAILARPDVKSMVPELALAPDLQKYNASAWSGGDADGGRLQAAIQAAINPVFRQLTNDILPGMRSSAIEAGAYTGDRAMKVEPGRAIADASGRAAEVAGQLGFEGYQNEQDRNLSAWQALEGLKAKGVELGNNADLGLFDSQNKTIADLFGITTQADSQNYATEQGAQLAAANNFNNANIGSYTAQTGAQNDQLGIKAGFDSSMYSTQVKALMDAFGINTDAAIRTADSTNNYNLGAADLGLRDATRLDNYNLGAGRLGLDAYTAESGNVLDAAKINNDFTLGSYDAESNALLNKLGIETDIYKTGTNAALDEAGMINNTNTTNRGMDVDALMKMFGIETEAGLTSARDQNAANSQQYNDATDALISMFNGATTRGLGTAQAEANGMDTIRNSIMDSMMLDSSQGDLLMRALETLTGQRQTEVDNALAKDAYSVDAPFRGLDTATQLMMMLSSNYGTQNATGHEKSVQSTSGLGSVVQGLAGLAGIAGSLVPGIGTAAAAASKAIPSAASAFMRG